MDNMPRKTLLLLTYFFPPTAAVAVHRMLGYVRFLPRFGWNVVVVAPPSVPGEPEDSALLEQVPTETTIIRVPFPGGFLGKIARRLSTAMSWVPAAIRACGQAIGRHAPHALLTSSPPPAVHYAGLYLRKRFGLPWIVSLRDPWIANRQCLMGLHRFEALVEPRVMRNASAIVANTPLNLDGLRRAYPDCAARMMTIVNGFDPERFPSRQPSNDDAITLLHAGELYSGRDPRPLLDALQYVSSNGAATAPGFRVQFLGRATESLCDLPTEIARRGLSGRADVLGQVPYADALQRMVDASILVLIHSPRFRIGVPAKLYEYLGAGRPILALAEPDGDIAWALHASGVPHRIAPTHDVAAIRRALLELRGQVLTGDAARSAKLANFTREAMARRLAACLDAAVDAEQRRRPLNLAPLREGGRA